MSKINRICANIKLNHVYECDYCGREAAGFTVYTVYDGPSSEAMADFGKYSCGCHK